MNQQTFTQPKAQNLNLLAVIGFNGGVIDGLILHPDNETLIFPIGSQIVVRNVLSRQDRFLKGHTNDISTLTVSNSGRYLASGQKTFSGFKADIILWDLTTLSIVNRFSIHKFLIQSLSFSYNDKYLVSLGGIEDNFIIVWEIETGKPLCCNTAGSDFVHQVKFFNNSDNKIVTCQNYGIKIWTVDYIEKKVSSVDVNFGNLKRKILCMIIDPKDKFAYVGTETGDILEIDLQIAIYKRIGPVKRLFPQGINCIKLLPNKDLLLGSKEGIIAKINFNDFRIKKEGKVLGGVTSMTLTTECAYFFCGTEQSNIYWVETASLKSEIRNTCHNDRVNDIHFPYEYSGVFGTCGKEDIRIWNTETRQEHLRIHVPNIECYCFDFMRDGKSIYSGWNDGKIRTFLPQSGKLLYAINECHANGVTAICATSDGRKIVSGGMNGEIRVWKIGNQSQTMETSLKEHRGRVFSIVINSQNDRAVSASADGSCIIWDIINYVRTACLFERTLFKQIVYHPEESQILTTGTNKKITYWDVTDYTEIRSVDATLEGSVNSLSMFKSGEFFVSAGDDREVKIWEYDTAIPRFKGLGHSNPINKVIVAPNQEIICSVSEDGSIFIFATPKETRVAKRDLRKPQ